jgi:hypothetical protein
VPAHSRAYAHDMHRLRRFRRIPRSSAIMIGASLIALVFDVFFLHGSAPKVVSLGPHRGKIPVDQTGAIDIIRFVVGVARSDRDRL